MKVRRLLFILLAVIALLLLALLVVILVVGPEPFVIKLGHKHLPDAPAPTTVPLATVSPKPTGTPQATSASPATTVAATDMPGTAVAPTRVVLPVDQVSLPPGFGISVFAAGLRGPRMMALGPDGELYLAERGASRIVRLPDRDGDGVAEGSEVVAEDLNVPSSIAFYEDGSLYVGETTRILRLSAPDASGVFQEREVIVDGLPEGGHNTRTVLFSPDWSTLYVSVGSSCNVCIEVDERRAAIVRYD
ncbi:MAG: sorbosone dehydrogenase family protein, partial [Anaerolineae bacterium]